MKKLPASAPPPVQSALDPAAMGYIQVRGARTHNLKDIDVAIPRQRLVVVTGPSGSGKSSLAFDTIYAEGKRQFIETLSTYARQFLEQVPRPDVDSIEGLPPTLCIDQRPGHPSPRSTVATITEIHDHLRLLMARLGTARCHQCGQVIRPRTTAEILDRLQGLPEGSRLMILAPMLRKGKGNSKDALDRIRRAGFVRVRVDGTVRELDQVEIRQESPVEIDAVVDRIIVRPDVSSRLIDSLRLALQYGNGLVAACHWTLDVENDETDADAQLVHDEWFSTKAGCIECGIESAELEPRTFSFNSPYGACSTCDGLGTTEAFDPDLVIPDRGRSLASGAIRPWQGTKAKTPAREQVHEFLARCGLDESAPLSLLSDVQWQQFLKGGDDFPGLLQLLERDHATATVAETLHRLSGYRGQIVCATCQGSRLRPEATNVQFRDLAIHQITQMSIADCLQFFRETQFDQQESPIATPIASAILARLQFLHQVGLGYLTLDRSADSLSGGEFQRVRLASSIGSGLVGVCFILDEPSIGLHQRDNRRLIDALRSLQRQGNSVLVVEHDEEVMRNADYLIDVGPGAGTEGGEIVAVGTPDDVANNPASITGTYLAGGRAIEVPASRRKIVKSRALTLLGAGLHNLREIDVMIPLGVFVCVTGVSGSGKSSLIDLTLAPALLRRLGRLAPAPGPFRGLRGSQLIRHVVRIDQSPLGTSPRSNAATYSGVLDDIRKIFANTPEAKQRGFRASRFSFNNRDGRCPACQGQGVQKLSMSFLPDLAIACSECNGARYNRATTAIRYRSKSIADVLSMSVNEATKFFESFASITGMLTGLQDVGLGYLPLGQPATTFSGGEAQRVKLAHELSRQGSEHTLYLLDEPTTGLHFDDIRRLIDVLQRLVHRGHSVVVIEHNLDVIKCADWIIDLGPEGGDQGGGVVAEGPPEEIARCPGSFTGQYLAGVLG